MDLKTLLDRPIAFQRAFVSLGAGVTGALMLSQSVYWSTRGDDADGWFYKTMSEWEDETGLTRSEQEGARKKLVRIGVLEEMKKGVPCRLYYRVNMDALAANLGAEKPKTSMRKTRKPVCRKPANKSAEIQQASVQESSEQACGKPAFLTENTTEITTETTQRVSAGEAAPSTGQSKLSDSEADRQDACRAIWSAYSSAYLERYETNPVRNAKVNRQVDDLRKRLGGEAPAVAAFFVWINDQRLIHCCHEFGSLLAKAEAYRTQWATNRQVTSATARQAENTQSNLSAAQQALAEQRARRNAHAHG